jgi:hypothetical protein
MTAKTQQRLPAGVDILYCKVFGASPPETFLPRGRTSEWKCSSAMGQYVSQVFVVPVDSISRGNVNPFRFVDLIVLDWVAGPAFRF